MGSFWGHVGVTLGSFWGHVGVTLGSLWGLLRLVLGGLTPLTAAAILESRLGGGVNPPAATAILGLGGVNPPSLLLKRWGGLTPPGMIPVHVLSRSRDRDKNSEV